MLEQSRKLPACLISTASNLAVNQVSTQRAKVLN